MDHGVSSGVEVVGVYRNDSLSDKHGAAVIVVTGEAWSAFFVSLQESVYAFLEGEAQRYDQLQLKVFIPNSIGQLNRCSIGDAKVPTSERAELSGGIASQWAESQLPN